MAIKVWIKDGLACPTIVCDWCDLEITDASMGLYHWTIFDGASDPVFLHKDCNRSYEAAHKAKLKAAGETFYCHELSEFLIALGNNAGINWRQYAEQMAR